MSGLGIDLGTANTVVCHARRGILLDEPSLMLLRAEPTRHPKPLAVGLEARQLLGRTPPDLVVVRPLQDGVITDLERARAFIVAILRRATRKWNRVHVKAAIGVPIGASPLERRALFEAADEAGIERSVLIGEPIAGAIGSGIDPMDNRVHLVVDIGGGTSEVSAFCAGGILDNRSCRVAGDEMTFAVYQYLRDQHQLQVGELVAEELKIRASNEPGPSLVVEGRDAATGRPRLVTLAVTEVADAVKPVVEAVISTLAACLDDLPPQSVGDVLRDGILLVGGGSLMPGFDKAVENAFGFSVTRADEPLTSIAVGAAHCVANNNILSAYGYRS